MNSKGVMQQKNFFCGRTKAAALINCLREDIKKDLIKDKSISFSLMVDESNDAGHEKMFPISTRIFDVNFNQIMTSFLT